MRKSVIALLACASALVSTGPAVAAVTYTSGATSVGSSGSYTLSLTTDGTLGSLQAYNITDFAIDISDATGSLTLTPGNAGILIASGGLSASAADLFFNYNGGGYALFQSPFVGSGKNFLCFAGSPCGNFAGATNLAVNNPSVVSTTAYQGTVKIASVNSAVPEPATWAMVLLGFGCIGFAMRLKKDAPVRKLASVAKS